MEDTQGSTKDWELAIKQLESVKAVRINTDKQGRIEEIHVTSGFGRGPKQIARDIESVLIAQFNLQVDHKKISIAKMRNAEAGVVLAITKLDRAKVIGVAIEIIGVTAEVRVQLFIDDKMIEGTAFGPYSQNNKLRLLVKATINALEMLTMDKFILLVEDVEIALIAKKELAIVALTLIESSGEQCITGCALVKDNDNQKAVVRATLDAINRKINN